MTSRTNNSSSNTPGLVLFNIPTEPSTSDGGPPSLLQQNNLQCLCWEQLRDSINLLVSYRTTLWQHKHVCAYHRVYFQRRINAERPHLCTCHYEPDGRRCTDCGYCHNCGCDLVTTSTNNFHRCTCALCLVRCCGVGVTSTSFVNAHRRHNFLRARQAEHRCEPGTPPNRRGCSTPFSTEDIESARLLNAPLPLVPTPLRPRALTEDPDTCNPPTNVRWPPETTLPTNPFVLRGVGRPNTPDEILAKGHSRPEGRCTCNWNQSTNWTPRPTARVTPVVNESVNSPVISAVRSRANRPAQGQSGDDW